jgi:hypothetical protein
MSTRASWIAVHAPASITRSRKVSGTPGLPSAMSDRTSLGSE